MPLSIAHRLSVTASALSADPRQAAQLSRQLGFGGLIVDCYGAIDLTELSITGRRDWLRPLAQQDQKLVALQVDLGRSGLGPGADVDHQLRRLERALDTAAGLRAGLMCVELGLLPRVRNVKPTPKAISPGMAGAIFIPSFDNKPAASPEVLPPPDPTFVAQVQYALTELGGIADRYGVMMAFSSSLSSLQSLHAAIVPLACPWFGFDLDPVVSLRDGISIDETFTLVTGSINHARLRDAIVGDDNRTRPVVVGSGNVKWPEFLQAIEGGGYAGPLTIDPAELGNRLAAAQEGRKKILATAEEL